ncbi:MAG: hypothetical protein AABX54_04740 [Nanoarchaeota archaeon]
MKPHGLYHISEILKESYEDRVRDVLDFIELKGLALFTWGDELKFLLGMNALTQAEISRAENNYQMDSHFLDN